MEGKKVCTSVFLDIKQAFDKVWHKRLLYKLKKNLSDQLYLILKSYLSKRYFQVKIDYELSVYHRIRAGVPQGSILGPLLYLIFTADVPLTENTLMSTFADDSNNVIRPRS
jgi:retron-type reverse transcriptase